MTQTREGRPAVTFENRQDNREDNDAGPCTHCGDTTIWKDKANGIYVCVACRRWPDRRKATGTACIFDDPTPSEEG